MFLEIASCSKLPRRHFVGEGEEWQNPAECKGGQNLFSIQKHVLVASMVTAEEVHEQYIRETPFNITSSGALQ